MPFSHGFGCPEWQTDAVQFIIHDLICDLGSLNDKYLEVKDLLCSSKKKIPNINIACHWKNFFCLVRWRKAF